MKKFRIALLPVVIVLMAGCAHEMTIRPDVATIDPAKGHIDKNVGLYISPSNHALEVTGPGGGGDKVKYHPYADMEAGLYKALSNVFTSVTVLSSPTDADAIAKHSLNYIVEPTLTTTSSSSGVFTWMATDFKVDVSCKVSDPRGKPVTTVNATGIGKAESSEVRSDFSIAGERASRDALLNLEAAFLQSPELKQ